MYSSQQNLSTRYTSHNSFEKSGSSTTNNNNNINRNKIYGSTSNIAILQKNLGSTGFSVAPPLSSNNNNNNYTPSTNKQNNNKNVNMTNISVDNWLNAWDNPELQREQQKIQQQQQQRHQFKAPPPVAAKKPTFDYNSNTSSTTKTYQYRNNTFDSTKPITLPLKPIQIHSKNVQRTGKFNDPWAGDFTFIFYFFTFNF